jgi:hypothetical protein
MRTPKQSAVLPSVALCPDDEYEIEGRIRAEFKEMPGLNLTLQQASRLFGLEPAVCEQVLGALVRQGDLGTDGRVFARAGSGRLWH